MPLHKHKLYMYIKMGCVGVNKMTYWSVTIGEPIKKFQSFSPTGWQAGSSQRW